MWKDKQGRTLQDYVERYIALGWNIFPVAQGTKGGFLAKWKELQQRKQSPDEIRKRFEQFYEKANINIALIIGRTSNNTVVTDFDGIKLHELLEGLMPDTMVSKTGSGKGFHRIYETEEIVKTDQKTYTNERIKPRRGKIGNYDHIDIQGEGAIIILPPSVHPETGERYEWLKDDWVKETPQTWFGPFHATFRAIANKKLNVKAQTDEINVSRLILGNFSKGEDRPVRAFEYLTYLKSRNVEPDEMWEIIADWNESNDPPIEEEKLRGQWKWVEEHELYKLRFVEKEVKVFSKEILAAAEKRLMSPDLEDWTQKTFDAAIFREHNNRMVGFYVLLTGVMKDGKWKQILIIKGDPGGGKSHMANALTRLFVTLKRARFSERAIDYMCKKIGKHQILYLNEFAGVSDDSPQGGISTMKFMAADDGGYIVEVYAKDPDTGEPTTIEMHVPPITVVTTSIAIHIESQFARRSITLNVNDSIEQTLGVMGFKAQKELEHIQEFVGITKPSDDLQILEATLTLLESCDIGLLFGNVIIELFKGSIAIPLRLRGDYDKLITLIKMRAFFHQKQRPWIQVGKTKMIFALPEDLSGILKYAKDTVLEMTTGLEKRLVRAIPDVYELKDNVVNVYGEGFTGFTVEDFRKKHCPRKSYNTAKSILDGLSDVGIISFNKKGSTKIYGVNITQIEAEKLSVSIAKNEIAKLLESKAESAFEKQFSDLLQFATETIYVNQCALDNSEFLRRIVEKNKDKVTVVASCNHSETGENQTNSETVEGNVANQ